MDKKENIPCFTKDELRSFFYVLEKKINYAETPYKKSCAIRNNAMFKIMYYCGLRVTETILLEEKFYNISKNEIYCERIDNGISNTLIILDDDVIEALERHINENNTQGYLFKNLLNNKPLSRKTVDVILKEACEEAEIKDKKKWNSQTLRHTRGFDLVDQGFTVDEVQFWLGLIMKANALVYFPVEKNSQHDMYEKLRKRRK